MKPVTLLPSAFICNGMFVLILSFMYKTSGKITYPPSRTEAVVGDTIELSCKKDPITCCLRWEHVAVGQSLPTTLTYRGRVNKDRLSMDLTSETGIYNLTIKNVQPEDAGTYKCSDENENEKQTYTAELIVMENPICRSNLSRNFAVTENDCGVSPDYIQLQCSVIFYGTRNKGLDLIWINQEEDGIKILKDNKFTTILVTQVKWNRDGFVSYTCATSLNKSLCHTRTWKLNYCFNTSAATTVELPKHVTCAVNSSQPCHYRWTKNEVLIVPNAELNLTAQSASGIYICWANCRMLDDYEFCRLQPMRINFNPKIDQIKQDMIWMVPTTLLGLLIITIMMCLLCHHLYRKRQQNRESDSEPKQRLISESNFDSVGYMLLESASRGDLASLKTLHENGKDMSTKGYDERTALHLAAAGGHLECVRFLLEVCQVPPNPRDRWKYTPFDEAKRFMRESVKNYLGSRESTNDYIDVIDSASRGKRDELEQYYKENQNMAFADYDGRTALHLAASEGYLECVKFLLENCLVPHNPRDRWGDTPLDDAKREGHTDVKNYLASYVKPVISNNLIISAFHGHIESLKKHRRSGQDMAFADHDGRTALHLAASEGHLECVRYLLEECQVSRNPKDRWNNTPVDDAKRHGRKKVEEYLTSMCI